LKSRPKGAIIIIIIRNYYYYIVTEISFTSVCLTLYQGIIWRLMDKWRPLQQQWILVQLRY